MIQETDIEIKAEIAKTLRLFLVEIHERAPSLRDYFAAAALTGEIHFNALRMLFRLRQIEQGAEPEPDDDIPNHELIVRNCYNFADFMLAARKQKGAP